MEVKVALDPGAAGPAPNQLVAPHGEQIKDLDEKTISLKTHEGIHQCITFRTARVIKPLATHWRSLRGNEKCHCSACRVGHDIQHFLWRLEQKVLQSIISDLCN